MDAGHRHVATKAILAGLLTVAMGVAPAVTAVAETTTAGKYGTGAITITNVKGNVTTFKGHLIFKANVVDSTTSTTGKDESNVDWANDDVKAAVEGVIKSVDAAYAGTTAQDAATWIQEHADEGFHTGKADDGSTVTADSDQAVKNHTWVDSATVGDAIAHAVDGKTTDATLTAGEKKEGLAEGWWLFTTDPASLDSEEEAGTSPIFTVIGGSDVTTVEKVKLPTSVKEVKNDADGSVWGYVSDSQRGQKVDYKIIGTVSGNVNTFDTYHYEFQDVLSKGLTFDDGAVVVKAYASKADADTDLDGTDATKGVDLTAAFKQTVTANDDKNTTLDLNCTDLKASLKDSAAPLTRDTVVVVYYKAELNDDCVIGLGDPADPANPNTAKVIYSNNPYSTGDGETKPSTPRDYTYQLLLNKVDRNTEVKLSGAKFTIQCTEQDDAANKGKYVQADGRLGDQPYEFTTDSNGQISVTGMDAGTYTVHETLAPTNYTAVDDFTFTIEPTYGKQAADQADVQAKAADAEATKRAGTVSDALAMAEAEQDAYDTQWLTALSTTVTGKEGDVIAGVSDGVTGDNKLVAAADNKATDITTGTVQVTVGDVRHVDLPFTGEQGTGIAVLLGGAGVVISLAAAMRRKREQAEDAE